MVINKVTLTGPDNKITGIELLEIQKKYPFVEWGILFSKNKEGEQRYPTLSHMEKEFFNSSLQLSAHFCGWYAKEVLENQNFALIKNLQRHFQRFQINYNFSNSRKWDLVKLLHFCQDNPKIEIILQWNRSNSKTLEKFLVNGLPKNIHFLYDASGGRGTEIQEIHEPIDNQYTGYAGGLNPENISDICQIISDDQNEKSVWIDMESGVRTNNDFDLNKVKQVLESTFKFIHPY